MLHTSVSEPDTLHGEVPANVEQLQAAVAALEEQLTGRGIFRRFVAAQTARGSLSHDACSSASFLSAAAGFMRSVRRQCCSAQLICTCSITDVLRCPQMSGSIGFLSCLSGCVHQRCPLLRSPVSFKAHGRYVVVIKALLQYGCYNGTVTTSVITTAILQYCCYSSVVRTV